MANLTLASWRETLQISGIHAIADGILGCYTKNEEEGFLVTYELEQTEGLSLLHFKLQADQVKEPTPLKLVWKIPAINYKGTWTSNFDHTKRVYAEWESVLVQSRAAFESPVIGLFGHDDSNLHTFACSDAINLIQLGAGLREESSWVYCSLELFTERMPAMDHFEFSLRLDSRSLRYEKALEEVSDWWAEIIGYHPMSAPDIARMPMYSTWYNFHQNLSEDTLLAEGQKAVELGYQTIIIDDGWQTNDNNRGYAYTGDWQPDRFENMAELVKKIHALGMKVMLWYSVPFLGKSSVAYQQFASKTLNYSEEWNAAILDPRYPAVRAYIIDVYVKALLDWNLDGFKLDFIDNILAYPSTELTQQDGRDYASVNAGVDRLMSDICTALRAINPEIMIEFRQHYIGPLMRKFGNIFRAHDCPNDAITNRVRTTDLRLLSGNTVIHSDMLMWNYQEPVHLAALQFLNILFSVPQLSVNLAAIPADHLAMVAFYTRYWIDNRLIFLDAPLVAHNPAASYPELRAKGKDKQIIAAYSTQVISWSEEWPEALDIINAKDTDFVILDIEAADQNYSFAKFDCMGEKVADGSLIFRRGPLKIKIPASGLLQLKKINA